ncbi:MAG: histidine phosphatase family protein [Ktedonobacterales bacterium]
MAEDERQAGASEELTDAQRDPFLSLRNGATEVYFVRHGDALPGVDEVILGDYDAQALSSLGRRQAEALAQRMRQVAPTAIYSSPTGRARQTAQPTADALGLTIQIAPDLREVELGAIGGDLAADADAAAVSALLRRRLRDIAVIALTSGTWASIPGSEPSAQLRQRVSDAIAHIATQHAGQRVLVVSHGGAINAWFAALLGIERDYFFPAANTSISVARVKGERRLLMALNDISHLREAGVFEESVRPPTP